MLASVAIPFVDLVTPHAELEEELVHIFRQVLKSGGFVGGPLVEELEASFARYCGVKHAIGVSSGTDALRFAIMACGVGPGDVVLTVPNTFIATSEAITQAGAYPQFIDIDPSSCNMSIKKLREFLEQQCVRGKSGELVSLWKGRSVTAIVPVHLYGQMADMDGILDLADQYGLAVIEDACQAHGAEYHSERAKCWLKAGSMGHAAAFSFYPGKNLGACGEGGAVTTNNSQIAQRVKLLRDHGQSKKYYHEAEGYNGRLDAIQAGIVNAKMPYLDGWNELRRTLASHYKQLLSGIKGIHLPGESVKSLPVYHLYVIRTANRNGLKEYLQERGINTGIHYPVPLHLQRAYRWLHHKVGDFPVTERIAEELLSLPMYPQLTEQQQMQIAERIRDWAKVELS